MESNITPIVNYFFHIQFVHTDSESYHAIKAMIELWNPEGSKWASQISRNYKMDLDLDDHGARDPKPIEWFEEPKIDGRVKKMVEVKVDI